MTKNWTLKKTLPYILLIAGIIGYICAFIITFDKIKLLENPNYIPSCNLNPIISCGSVMQSHQANAFGFPNPFIGLGAFPVVAVIGGAMLAGATFKKWFWLGFNGGLLFALGFVHWLFFQSVYNIHALCPWCMVVWVVSITSFWYVSLYNIDNKNIRLPKGKPQKLYSWVRRHHLDILILWFLIIAALILKHFWYYYGQHL
ncbi:MAG TPA: vitamin K epoxide reductase family protein [Candidatus Saccharimonadales bacterium]|nr:vitamin K epoxide reductase family protein [Candidatus Saccharimonadales bacterium]